MNRVFVIRFALRSLRRTLLRSVLTTLGIVIGVAAIITMVCLGNGAKAQIENTFTSKEWSRIHVAASNPIDTRAPGEPPKAVAGDAGLTTQDYLAILSEITEVELATRSAVIGDVRAAANGRRLSLSVIGWEPSAFELRDRVVLRGDKFGESDVRRANAVCLITDAAARSFFSGVDPIGQPIALNGTAFVVSGIVLSDQRLADPLNGGSEVSAYIPVTSLLRRLDPNASLTLLFQAKSRALAEDARQKILNLLESRRGKRKVRFHVYQSTDGQRQLAEGSATMAKLLAAIAGVSLIVGGIGIMNITLVNVAERTREIGIRLAIGTRERDVARQFLAEAVIISVFGGILGVLLGIIWAKTMTYINGWPTIVSLRSALGTILCCAAIGICFGYYPARRAACLDPIQALRSE